MGYYETFAVVGLTCSAVSYTLNFLDKKYGILTEKFIF